MGRTTRTPAEQYALDARRRDRTARRTAHLDSRLRRGRSMGGTVSSSLLARLGLFEPILFPKVRKGATWGRTGNPVETDWGTVSVTGRACQLHASLLETLFWRMTSTPERQEDGSMLITVPLGTVCRDLSTTCKTSTETPKRLLQDLTEATFSLDLKLKRPWAPPAGADFANHLFGPFVSAFSIEKEALGATAHPIVLTDADGEETDLLAASRDILRVCISRPLYLLMKYDLIRSTACRLPLLQIHNGPVQAAIRWILAQTRIRSEQPAGGGWYYLRNAVMRVCGDRPDRWMDQQISAARAVEPAVWAALGLETCNGRAKEGGRRSDVKVRFCEDILIDKPDKEDGTQDS